MKSKGFLLFKAVIAIVFAFLMLFFARTFLNWILKADIPAAAQLGPYSGLGDLIRLGFGFFGAMLVGVAIISYFASSATASVLRKKVILGLAVGDTLGLILALMAQLSGKFTGLGWIIVLLWLVVALSLFYSFFTEKTD